MVLYRFHKCCPSHFVILFRRSKTRDYVWNHNITIDSLAGSSQISVASLDGSQSRKSKLSTTTSNGALPYRAFEIPDELRHPLWRSLIVLKTVFCSFRKVMLMPPFIQELFSYSPFLGY